MKTTKQSQSHLPSLSISTALLLIPAFVGMAQAQQNNTTNGPNASTTNGIGAGAAMTTGSGNSAYGFSALKKNTTGNANTAFGELALFSNTTGETNTAIGSYSLHSNTTGGANTATGNSALVSNTTGYYNTASGDQTLYSNTTGSGNTASGATALSHNTTGNYNTACGANALTSNLTGNRNSASGYDSLRSNTTGDYNTACGELALLSNTTGSFNTALGRSAGANLTIGKRNLILGSGSGSLLTSENNNIIIGHAGLAGESNAIRIGTNGTQTKTFIAGVSGKTSSGGVAVFINSSGQLGTLTSSRRFKDEIKDMAGASEALFSLRPVTFRYKPELDAKRLPQWGLIAEEVSEVNPDLVVRDDKGEIQTVRYEQVNAMLLNEFLKDHRRLEALRTENAAIKQELAELHKSTEARLAALENAARPVVACQAVSHTNLHQAAQADNR